MLGTRLTGGIGNSPAHREFNRGLSIGPPVLCVRIRAPLTRQRYLHPNAVEPSRTDQEAFESTLAEVCSASITYAKVRWSGKVQFSPGSTSRARIGESGNNSGRAFFHLAKATLFAISRSLT